MTWRVKPRGLIFITLFIFIVLKAVFAEVNADFQEGGVVYEDAARGDFSAALGQKFRDKFEGSAPLQALDSLIFSADEVKVLTSPVADLQSPLEDPNAVPPISWGQQDLSPQSFAQDLSLKASDVHESPEFFVDRKVSEGLNKSKVLDAVVAHLGAARGVHKDACEAVLTLGALALCKQRGGKKSPLFQEVLKTFAWTGARIKHVFQADPQGEILQQILGKMKRMRAPERALAAVMDFPDVLDQTVALLS